MKRLFLLTACAAALCVTPATASDVSKAIPPEIKSVTADVGNAIEYNFRSKALKVTGDLGEATVEVDPKVKHRVEALFRRFGEKMRNEGDKLLGKGDRMLERANIEIK